MFDRFKSALDASPTLQFVAGVLLCIAGCLLLVLIQIAIARIVTATVEALS